jgi:hypothetical protein
MVTMADDKAPLHLFVYEVSVCGANSRIGITRWASLCRLLACNGAFGEGIAQLYE